MAAHTSNAGSLRLVTRKKWQRRRRPFEVLLAQREATYYNQVFRPEGQVPPPMFRSRAFASPASAPP